MCPVRADFDPTWPTAGSTDPRRKLELFRRELERAHALAARSIAVDGAITAFRDVPR